MSAERTFVRIGALSASLAVAAGAFGAHALRTRMDADLLQVFETAARYQMYHALALVGVAWATSRTDATGPRWAGWLFVAGTLLFSGSLYLIALTDTRWPGAVAPLGGAAWIAGWALLAWTFRPSTPPRL